MIIGIHFTSCGAVPTTNGLRVQFHDKCVDVLAEVIRTGNDRGKVGHGPFVSKAALLEGTAVAMRRLNPSGTKTADLVREDNRMPDIRWSESEYTGGQRTMNHHSLDVNFRCITASLYAVACTCEQDGLTLKYGRNVCCCFGRYRRPGLVAESRGDAMKIDKHRATEAEQQCEFHPFSMEQPGAFSRKARALLKRLVKRVYDRNNWNAAFFPGVFRRGVHRRLVSIQSRLHSSLLVHGSAAVITTHHRGRVHLDYANNPCSSFHLADLPHGRPEDDMPQSAGGGIPGGGRRWKEVMEGGGGERWRRKEEEAEGGGRRGTKEATEKGWKKGMEDGGGGGGGRGRRCRKEAGGGARDDDGAAIRSTVQVQRCPTAE